MRRSSAVSVAVIVPTPELLKQMVDEKPACWTWAAFASVVFQRWGALEVRKIDQVLGSPVQSTGQLQTGPEVAQFVTRQLRAVDDIIAELTLFLSSTAFAEVFGAPDENSADAEGIVRAANQVGDYYQRLLELAEDCRSHSVSKPYMELVGDCTRFIYQALQDFGRFVDGVLERLEEQQRRVMLGQGVHFEPLELRTTTDDRLMWSILDQLKAME